MSRLCVFASIAFMSCVLSSCAAVPPDRPVVRYQDNIVTGDWSADGQVAAFLGVPFAEPPTGERRWRAPVPLTRPVDIDASRYAAACMQGGHIVTWYRGLVEDFGGDPGSFPTPEFSEDCLYLNIWTPAIEPDAALPVMVWIHGGGYEGGWPYEPNYIGDELAREGVVVVSIPYRLGVFGFFSHPALEVSNFGLLDQVAALRWVQDNIGEFGGDADNVTVFGESAGAASIGYLQASPLGKGLFHRVIHQSGGYQLIDFDTRERLLAPGVELEQRVAGASGKTGIDALRQASAEALLTAVKEVYADLEPDVVVDGQLPPETVSSALENGRLASLDILIGTNADEWLMYLEPDSDESAVVAQADAYGLADPDAVMTELSEDVSTLRKLDRLVTAHNFVCPSLELAAAAAEAGKSAYVYYFSRVRHRDGGARIGAYHGAELPYVFDKHDEWLPTEARDRQIGRLMTGYWAAFAKSGDPNFSAAPEWPAYSRDNKETLDIGDQVQVIPHPEAQLCRAMAQ